MASSGISNAVSRADHHHDYWDGIDRTSAFSPFTSGTPFINTFSFPLVLYATDVSGSFSVSINGTLLGSMYFATGTFIVSPGSTVLLSWAGASGRTHGIVFLS